MGEIMCTNSVTKHLLLLAENSAKIMYKHLLWFEIGCTTFGLLMKYCASGLKTHAELHQWPKWPHEEKSLQKAQKLCFNSASASELHSLNVQSAKIFLVQLQLPDGGTPKLAFR